MAITENSQNEVNDRVEVSKKLYFGGRIITMDDRTPFADALITEQDKIVWVGSAHELSAVPSDSYEMIDLDGATMLPGLIDSHAHLVYWSQSLYQVDLDGANSYEDALKRIKLHLTKFPPRGNEWFLGKGWRRDQWRNPRWPDRKELDRLIPDRPAAIFSKDAHALWVNSRALAAAGITRETDDPAGGEIMRDQHHEPTGVLTDEAYKRVWEIHRAPSRASLKRMVREGIERLHRLGCVGVSNFDFEIDRFAVLQELELEGNLPLRVRSYLPVKYLDQITSIFLRTGFGSDNLRVAGVKIFADGALGSQTALMLKPFKGSRNNVGLEVTPPAELVAQIGKATRAGLACAIHAIGDRANRQVLDAIEQVGRHVSKRFPHRIEHCQILNAQDLHRFARLGVTASMQPSHAPSDIDIMKKYLGPRLKDSYRFRSLAKSGVLLALGSDAPIEELHPLHGVYAATTGRRLEGGRSYNSNETLTVAQALHGFTLGGALAVGDGKMRGSLTPGKKADIVIVDTDPLRAKPEQLLATKVLATIIDGEFCFAAEGMLR